MHFDGCKVFNATKQKEREQLGDRVTEWIASEEGQIEIVDKAVRQSSDNQFHCISITVFFRYLDN